MPHKRLIVLIVVPLVAGLIALAYSRATPGLFESVEANLRAAIPEVAQTPAPEFPQKTQWIQSEPLKLADLRGRVVIVQFWTFGCINCIHNYPVYKAWQEKYADKAVTISSKARENGLKFPIAIDNDKRIWKDWDNHAWPSIYLVDKKGRVRYNWEGELHLENPEARQFAARIDDLLAEKQ
jgi:thiol-disulfide isomerase/thioredoxin